MGGPRTKGIGFTPTFLLSLWDPAPRRETRNPDLVGMNGEGPLGIPKGPIKEEQDISPATAES